MKKYLIGFIPGILIGTSAVALAVTRNFPDVSSNAYYANAVTQMADWSVIKGYDNGNFGPDDSVTRGQIATILSRYNQALVSQHSDDNSVGTLIDYLCDKVTPGNQMVGVDKKLDDLCIERIKSNAPQETIEPTSSISSYPQTEETWIEPVSLLYDSACLIESSNCSDLGQAQIGIVDSTVRARIFPISNDRENVEIRFYMGEKEWVIPRFTTTSFLDANSSWFGLKIWDNSGSSIYIATTGGHEGYPEYFVAHLGTAQPKWEKFDPWSYVKAEFPDTIQPPFSLEFGSRYPQYIRLTEENYCCDTSYSDTPERNANRMIYVLKQEYNNGQPIFTIVDRGYISR